MSIELVMLSNHLILCPPFSFCPQSFQASGSFPVSRLVTSGGQRIGASALASVLPVNIHGWFPLGWTGLTPCSPRASQEFSLALQFKSINSSVLSLSYGPALNICTWLLKKTIALTIRTSVVKVICLLFNTLSRFIIAFLPRSKCLLIAWQQ